MTEIPSKEALIEALNAAGSAHHEYQTGFLNGINDEQWAGFYAAYVLGSLGDFTVPSKLTALLVESPNSEDWAFTASVLVMRDLI